MTPSLIFKNLLFTVLVPGTVAGLVPWRLVRAEETGGLPTVLSGGALLLAGASIYFWCLWEFASRGRGTPAPIDAPRHLVVLGLYRYTRNPMYVGVLTVILGWAVVYLSVRVFLYALAVGTCFHLFVVLYEEPALRRQFGGEYDAYEDRVGRWLPRSPRSPV